jgi:Protein of unknown function (DUF4239)
MDKRFPQRGEARQRDAECPLADYADIGEDGRGQLPASSESCQDETMSDWLHELPLLWMAVAVFGVTYLATAAIYVIVTRLGKRVRAFKVVSPSILSPIGVLFALFVAFTAQQVLDDNDRAAAAVNREAAALSAVKFLAASFPGPSEAQMESLIRQYVEEAATQEWPAMAQQKAAVSPIPLPLAQALDLSLSLTPGNRGQEVAQREIATALENALDARRQRIIVSVSQVNLLKWCCLVVQALCTMLIIGIVHSESRLAAAIAMGTFAAGVAVSLLLVLSHDRPFMGELSVQPDPLLQVMTANQK